MTLLIIIYLQIVLRPMEMDPKKMALWFGSLLVQIKITSEDSCSPLELSEAFSRRYSKLLEESNESGVQKRYESNECYGLVKELLPHWLRWAFCMVTPFHPDLWHLMMYVRQRKTRVCRKDSEAGVQRQWSCIEITSRFMMSYVSNGLYKAIIVYTLPLWLCRGGLTDFVLNAFATVYIVELDDLKDRDAWFLPRDDQLDSKDADTSAESELEYYS